MDDQYRLFYLLRDGIICLGALVGIGGAIFLFVKKKILPAALSLIGFLLLALEPILDLVLWQWLNYEGELDYLATGAAHACISGPALFLSAALFTLAFIIGFREPKLPPPPLPEDLPPSI